MTMRPADVPRHQRIRDPLLGIALASLVTPLGAADLAAGKAKAEAVCQTCHGLDGRGVSAMVANIGGQQKQYLVKQLSDYRAGRREHAQMSIIATMLSEQDIDNVTEWYASVVATFEIPE
jgi:cytochrome c553